MYARDLYKKERIRILTPYRLFVTLTTLHSLPRCTDTLYEYYTKFVRLRQSIQPVSCDVRLMKVLLFASEIWQST